jgi:hypothetical protein
LAVNVISGADKSTLARGIGGLLYLSYVEIDSLFHGLEWTPNAHSVVRLRSQRQVEQWLVRPTAAVRRGKIRSNAGRPG